MRSCALRPTPYRRLGMTLIELLVVMSIIIILAAVSYYSFTSAKQFADKIDRSANAAIARVNRGPEKSALPAIRDAQAGECAGCPSGQLPMARVVAPLAQRPDQIPGQFIVHFKKSIQNPHFEAERLAERFEVKVLQTYNIIHPGFCVLQCDDKKIEEIRRDSAVKSVTQDRHVYACQSQVVPTGVKRIFSNKKRSPDKYILKRNFRPKHHANLVTKDDGQLIPVAIMDTGIDTHHPDLFVARAYDFTGAIGPPGKSFFSLIPDEGFANPFQDPRNIKPFPKRIIAPLYQHDTDGHGTHVAGIVGARHNDIGVRGVYPGAPLVSLRVMVTGAPGTGLEPPLVPPLGPNPPAPPPLGTPGMGSIFAALDFVFLDATAKKPDSIRVCLMAFTVGSKGGPPDTKMNEYVDKAANAGVFMVAAAGGNGIPSLIPGAMVCDFIENYSPASATMAITVGAMQISRPSPFPPLAAITLFPAVFPVPPCIIGANGGLCLADAEDGFYEFSNYGKTGGRDLQFVAPGRDVESLQPVFMGAGTQCMTGTSQAAAHIAGLIAMILDPNTLIGFKNRNIVDFVPPVTRDQAIGRLSQYGTETITDWYRPLSGRDGPFCTSHSNLAPPTYIMPNFFTN